MSEPLIVKQFRFSAQHAVTSSSSASTSPGVRAFCARNDGRETLRRPAPTFPRPGPTPGSGRGDKADGSAPPISRGVPGFVAVVVLQARSACLNPLRRIRERFIRPVRLVPDPAAGTPSAGCSARVGRRHDRHPPNAGHWHIARVPPSFRVAIGRVFVCDGSLWAGPAPGRPGVCSTAAGLPPTGGSATRSTPALPGAAPGRVSEMALPACRFVDPGLPLPSTGYSSGGPRAPSAVGKSRNSRIGWHR